MRFGVHSAHQWCPNKASRPFAERCEQRQTVLENGTANAAKPQQKKEPHERALIVLRCSRNGSSSGRLKPVIGIDVGKDLFHVGATMRARTRV